MTKSHNPFRVKFSKLSVADKLRFLRLMASPDTDVLEMVKDFFRIDPVVSVRQNGRMSLLTDGHVLGKPNSKNLK